MDFYSEDRESNDEEIRASADPDQLMAPLYTSPSHRLPVLLKHAATARECELARTTRLEVVQREDKAVRIRYAPPSQSTNDEIATSLEVTFPQLSAAAAARREADSMEKLRELRAMEANLQAKQTETAKFFQVLHELQLQSTSGAMKALLQQIFNVLFRAAYQLSPSSSNDSSNNAGDRDYGQGAPSPEFDPSAMEELVGHEYFSLYTHAQQTLEVVSLQKQRLETKLEMERSLEDELVGAFHQLERDLHVIRTQHLENHERVEAERAAVAALEEDHAVLLAQEKRLRKECGGLELQAERHRAQLSELQSKSAFLDFISRIPLKKHLEQKECNDQEDALQKVVFQEEAANARLEHEMARLDEQIHRLEHQFEQDVAHRGQLGTLVHEAEQIRDVTQLDCQRLRDCHTPRPAWDTIIEKIPELSNNDDIEWDEMQAAMGVAPVLMAARMDARASQSHGHDREDDSNNNDPDGDGDDDQEEEEYEDVGGQTQTLVKEILQWIERLQKHCGVNLHLSRIWHDIEVARVELNILQHQLDLTLRKHTRYGAGYARSGRNGGTASTKQRPKQEYICALGVHDEIPLFLRHQGKVKRHPLKKVELETLVRKVWTEKRQREKRNPHLRLPLDDVLYEKLHRKYGFQPLIAEWGYNILLSLDALAWDPEIELFLLCLTHAISDQVYQDQELLIDKCAALLVSLSESYGNESFAVERRVLLKDALVALRKFFPLKTSTQLQALEKAMIRDVHKMKRGGNDSILYIDDILPKGVSYPRGFFVKALRSQHLKEIQEYYTNLTAELESRDGHKTGELPLYQVKDAMLAVDPLADSNSMWNALVRGVGVKTRAQLEMHEIVTYKPLIRQMSTTGLLKFALNFDPTAELYWQRRDSMDLSMVTGQGPKPRLSTGSRKSSSHLVRSFVN